MQNSITLLNKGFESASYKTPQFSSFTKMFKKELINELKTIGAVLTDYNVGHFYVSGFFNLNGNCFYFTLSDVRGSEFKNETSLLYRTARDNKDFTGGHNCYVTIGNGMAGKMHLG